jgi:hypothetical protein
MPPIRRFLCPRDFSRFSRHALERTLAPPATRNVVRQADRPVLTVRA